MRRNFRKLANLFEKSNSHIWLETKYFREHCFDCAGGHLPKFLNKTENEIKVQNFHQFDR